MADGIGPDIAEVFAELGATATILSRDPVVSGQRLEYVLNSQATKPFIREHHLDATLPYNTLITTDDVILIDETGVVCLVMNKTPELFENSVVEYNAVLYKCNLPSTAHILRPSQVRDANYDAVEGWHIVEDSPIYGLLADRAMGTELEQGSPKVGQFPIWRIDLFVPKTCDIKAMDRLVVSPTEYYKVETVESYYYPGVYHILLVEDTRPMHTMVGDEVYDD